ncbi:hypothetical protein MKX03_008742 [Papaver bracteatum]|nr:hypothetical protein MKX03_008742 [Papaver bracteatum]
MAGYEVLRQQVGPSRSVIFAVTVLWSFWFHYDVLFSLFLHFNNNSAGIMCFFGKAAVDVSDCDKYLSDCLSTSDKPILVLYGLENAHAFESLRAESSLLCGTKTSLWLHQKAEAPSVKLESSNTCTANGRHDDCKQADFTTALEA